MITTPAPHTSSDPVARNQLRQVVVELEDVRLQLQQHADLEADVEHRPEAHFGAENNFLLAVVHPADAVPDAGEDLLNNLAVVELDADREGPVVEVGLFQPLRVLGEVGGDLLARPVGKVRVDRVRVLEAVDRDELPELGVLLGRPDLAELVRGRALLHVAGDELVELLGAHGSPGGRGRRALRVLVPGPRRGHVAGRVLLLRVVVEPPELSHARYDVT